MLEELNGDFIQWLRGFYHVARTGSVRKAALAMNRNPSTISYQLRCLEDELNVILFDRVRRSLRITEEGKKLLAWTISTFDTLKNLRSSVSNADGRLKGTVRMAGTLPIVTLAVPAIVNFIRKFPLVKLNIARNLASDVRKQVEDSESDFGLLPVLQNPAEDKFEILFKARPLLVFAKNNDWRIPPIPSLEDLKRLPFVGFHAQGSPDEFGFYAQNAGLAGYMSENAALSANNYHLIMRFVWHGLGVSILDELCFQATRFGAEWDKLGAIPLDHLLPNRLYGILSRKQKRMSPQALELIKALRTHFLNLPALNADEAWLVMRQQAEQLEQI